MALENGDQKLKGSTLQSSPRHLQGEILFENTHWFVAPNGLESKLSPLHDGGYYIETKRLLDPDEGWLPHILEKYWCDPYLFFDAFYRAQEILGQIVIIRSQRMAVRDMFGTTCKEDRTRDFETANEPSESVASGFSRIGSIPEIRYTYALLKVDQCSAEEIKKRGLGTFFP